LKRSAQSHVCGAATATGPSGCGLRFLASDDGGGAAKAYIVDMFGGAQWKRVRDVLAELEREGVVRIVKRRDGDVTHVRSWVFLRRLRRNQDAGV
jgi:hypothetical protein